MSHPHLFAQFLQMYIEIKMYEEIIFFTKCEFHIELFDRFDVDGITLEVCCMSMRVYELREFES